MASETKLSHTAAIILQALDAGFVYGFSIMEMTGLPSGTVYPAFRSTSPTQVSVNFFRVAAHSLR